MGALIVRSLILGPSLTVRGVLATLTAAVPGPLIVGGPAASGIAVTLPVLTTNSLPESVRVIVPPVRLTGPLALTWLLLPESVKVLSISVRLPLTFTWLLAPGVRTLLELAVSGLVTLTWLFVPPADSVPPLLSVT